MRSPSSTYASVTSAPYRPRAPACRRFPGAHDRVDHESAAKVCRTSTWDEAPGRTSVDQDRLTIQEPRLLTYRAARLSTRTLTHLSELLRARRREIGCRWRRGDPG